MVAIGGAQRACKRRPALRAREFGNWLSVGLTEGVINSGEKSMAHADADAPGELARAPGGTERWKTR
jgi:hypothetical protein